MELKPYLFRPMEKNCEGQCQLELESGWLVSLHLEVWSKGERGRFNTM